MTYEIRSPSHPRKDIFIETLQSKYITGLQRFQISTASHRESSLIAVDDHGQSIRYPLY